MKETMRLYLALFSLLMAPCIACSSYQRSLAEDPIQFSADDYDDVRSAWTVQDVYYEKFEGRLFAWSTFHSWHFRQALVSYRANLIKLTAEEENALLESERTAHSQYLDFFVALGTYKRRWNKLDKDDSFWRVRLIHSGDQEMEPLEITHINRKKQVPESFYPYVNEFMECYRVRFPRLQKGAPKFNGETSQFILRISSPKGRVDLTWEMEE